MAHLGLMLCRASTVLQAAVLDGLPFDPFSLHEDCLTASEVEVGGSKIADALVIALMIIILNKGIDLDFERTRQVVVFQEDAVLERLMPALDLALGLGMTRRSPEVLDVLFVEPLSQTGRDVAGAIIR